MQEYLCQEGNNIESLPFIIRITNASYRPILARRKFVRRGSCNCALTIRYHLDLYLLPACTQQHGHHLRTHVTQWSHLRRCYIRGVQTTQQRRGGGGRVVCTPNVAAGYASVAGGV
jgi:hypothetical protein